MLQKSKQVPFSHLQFNRPTTIFGHFLIEDSTDLKKFSPLPTLTGLQADKAVRSFPKHPLLDRTQQHRQTIACCRRQPDRATLAALISFLLGLIIVMLGIIGEYIWRIFDEVNHRPESVVEEVY